MNIQDILRPATRDELEGLSKRDLITLLLGEQDLRSQAEGWARALKDETYRIGEYYVRVKNHMYGQRSEKLPRTAALDDPSPSPKKPKGGSEAGRKRLPSERYPNAKVIEQEVEFAPIPNCSACGHGLKDSGMEDVTETLSVVPRQFIITRQHYHKYRCTHCHSDVKTAPTLPRIRPGSGYDDAMIIDVGLSKYCDLLPIERYAEMARRSGFPGLPPQSLIELTHYLAEFLEPIYQLLRGEILSAEILYADETPHRMLEGDKRSVWYLWGFSTFESSYFECHDTRSGDVASDILLNASCQYLVSDVYSGYHKAINVCNEERLPAGLSPVLNVFCNAHARRKFKELSEASEASTYYLQKYQEIYRSESITSNKSADERLHDRRQLKSTFDEMYQYGEAYLDQISSKSHDAQAIRYFLKNFEGLTRFLTDGRLPIDNNHQERQLRNPVIGRKTWYGTHSKRGAATAAKLFSIVESCKINKINPRQYLQDLVRDMHQKKAPYTPRQYKLQKLQI